MVSKMKKLSILIVLIMISLALTSCKPGASSSSNEYFKGTIGVMANYQVGSPPNRINFYSDTPSENIFNLYVDIHNRGSSNTRGGVYISGYNPYMIKIDGIDIQKTTGGWGDCDVDVGFGSNPFGAGNDGNAFGEGGSFWKALSGSLDCPQGSFNYVDDTNWNVNLNNLGDFLGESFEGVSFDFNRGDGTFGLSMPDGFNIQTFNRGVGMLVMMSGIDFTNYGGREFMLRPNSRDYPGGERITEAFAVKIENWPKEGLDNIPEVPFLLTNCYLYATYFAEPICIDPSPEENVPKACTSRTIASKQGQGAPVAVTKVDTINTRTTAMFDITIENVGGGRVFNMGYMSACSPYAPTRITSQYLNKVYLLDARIGDQQLKCNPDRGSPIELLNGKRQITCSYKIDYQTVRSAYSVPLVLEFGYGYEQTTRANTRIVRI